MKTEFDYFNEHTVIYLNMCLFVGYLKMAMYIYIHIYEITKKCICVYIYIHIYLYILKNISSVRSQYSRLVQE